MGLERTWICHCLPSLQHPLSKNGLALVTFSTPFAVFVPTYGVLFGVSVVLKDATMLAETPNHNR